jgi:hypothetical protein
MTAALSRCYSTVNGVKRTTFEPPTNEEFADVKALGQQAVAPLARYLDLQPKNDFTQLFAVKFLMAIGGPSTLGPLKRALAQDQWGVTRAAALSGIFQVSPAEATPMWRQHSAISHNWYGGGLTTCGVCINTKPNDRPGVIPGNS